MEIIKYKGYYITAFQSNELVSCTVYRDDKLTDIVDHVMIFGTLEDKNNIEKRIQEYIDEVI